MDNDYFLVPLTEMKAILAFRESKDAVNLVEIGVSHMFLSHPGLAIGFCISFVGPTLVYLSEQENFGRLTPGEPGPHPLDLEIARFN